MRLLKERVSAFFNLSLIAAKAKLLIGLLESGVLFILSILYKTFISFKLLRPVPPCDRPMIPLIFCAPTLSA